jgi:hypothetical protein
LLLTGDRFLFYIPTGVEKLYFQIQADRQRQTRIGRRGGAGKLCFRCEELERANHIILEKLQMGKLIKMQEKEENGGMYRNNCNKRIKPLHYFTAKCR